MTGQAIACGGMTWRARFYLTVAGLRHASTGLAAILLAHTWPDVDAGIPIPVWGLIFIAGASHLWYAAWSGSENNARVALAVSAVVTSVWAAAFWAFWLAGIGSPLGAILFTALTLKDLTVVRDPMRSPFEPIVREYLQGGE